VLVLTRRTGDSIVIDGRIVVTVLDVRGEVVRVGVDAPREIQIHRAEIYRALQDANRAAAAGTGEEAAAALQALVARRGRRPGDPERPGAVPGG
jgi:carbon storage regulator